MTLLHLLPLVIALIILLTLFATTLYARRHGYSSLGGRIVVRCRSGHLFTTIWMPGGSFKAVRLGWMRFQYCPVGRHWTFVTPVRDDELTPAERKVAERNRDSNIP